MVHLWACRPLVGDPLDLVFAIARQALILKAAKAKRLPVDYHYTEESVDCRIDGTSDQIGAFMTELCTTLGLSSFTVDVDTEAEESAMLKHRDVGDVGRL